MQKTLIAEPNSIWVELAAPLCNVLDGRGFHLFRVGDNYRGRWFKLDGSVGREHSFQPDLPTDTITVSATFRCRRVTDAELFELHLMKLSSSGAE